MILGVSLVAIGDCDEDLRDKLGFKSGVGFGSALSTIEACAETDRGTTFDTFGASLLSGSMEDDFGDADNGARPAAAEFVLGVGCTSEILAGLERGAMLGSIGTIGMTGMIGILL